MASKRLGKFRQWAGEVISTKDKTVTTEEFKELETDIELRRKGINRLHLASEGYHRYLSKKKVHEALPEEHDKLTPRDALGIVMIVHGEEFGEDSAFGTSLVKFGRGMCKVATLQETHALNFQGTFLKSLQMYLDEIHEYHAQKKKLDGRRLSYDAALSKLERLKNSKKEKDRLEAEEEMETAKAKYEETSESVQARMHEIQNNEIDQLKELETFLDLEIRLADKYAEVMRSVRDDWVDISSVEHVNKPRPKGHSHTFSATVETKSVRSHKSSKSVVIESSDDEDGAAKVSRTKSTNSRRKSDSEKQPSRPASRASRKRSDSTATTGEKEKADKSRKMGVTGWASSAVNSVTGRGKKDKENFVGLSDGEADEHIDDEDGGSRFTLRPRSSKPTSKKSTPTGSPSIPARIMKSSLPSSTMFLPDKKHVRALYDFSGSSDELSFKTGDEISVLNEVVEGWWMGELDGKKGLFPVTYTEPVLSPPSIKSAPAIPQRLGNWRRNITGTSSDEDDVSKMTLVGADDDSTSLASEDDDHLFGDHNHLMSHGRSPVYGTFSPGAEERDEEVPSQQPLTSHSYDEFRRNSELPRKPVLGRKAPPPPPPRRPQISLNGTPPPLPDRRPQNIRSHSTSAIAKAINDTVHIQTDLDGESSPFDSPIRSHFAPAVKHDPFNSHRS